MGGAIRAIIDKDEERLGQILSLVSGLTIVVASLGLFGLVSFTTTRRTKEIGIRKVLGASVLNIMVKLSQDAFMLVVISNFIAWPIVFYLMHIWLENFAYRIHLGFGLFLLGGGLSLLIAILTVSFHAVKSALANPIDSLRHE